MFTYVNLPSLTSGCPQTKCSTLSLLILCDIYYIYIQLIKLLLCIGQLVPGVQHFINNNNNDILHCRFVVGLNSAARQCMSVQYILYISQIYMLSKICKISSATKAEESTNSRYKLKIENSIIYVE